MNAEGVGQSQPRVGHNPG